MIFILLHIALFIILIFIKLNIYKGEDILIESIISRQLMGPAGCEWEKEKGWFKKGYEWIKSLWEKLRYKFYMYLKKFNINKVRLYLSLLAIIGFSIAIGFHIWWLLIPAFMFEFFIVILFPLIMIKMFNNIDKNKNNLRYKIEDLFYKSIKRSKNDKEKEIIDDIRRKINSILISGKTR